MGLLEGRAQAISGQFNEQDVANTLWAYATMGRKSGQRLMGLMEGRAEAAYSKISLYTWVLKRYLNTCRDLAY
jgi:hypothetical protein